MGKEKEWYNRIAMLANRPNAWQVVKRGGAVRAVDLLRAIADPATANSAEYRTGLLLRDATRALANLWSEPVLRRRLENLKAPPSVIARLNDPITDEVGFPSLEFRTMETTNPDDVRSMLRELGGKIHQPSQLIVGGSIALIMDALIIHETEDIDVVDEVPEPIRREHDLLAEYVKRYGLKITHFQSHYLPDGWRARVKSLDRFGAIDVFLVDSYDILTGKLFSRRSKDLDHIRHALKLLDVSTFRDRIARTTAAYRRDALLLEAGKQNWYILTGEEDLPAQQSD